MSLPHVDPLRNRGPLYRGYAKFIASPAGLFVSRNVAWKLDPHLLRLTGSRVGVGWPLPTALLETRGAKSGQPRTNGVIYFHDGEKVTLIASLAGAPHHPAWFHNIKAHPGDVVLGGERFDAEMVATEAERTRLFHLADRVFEGFRGYRASAAKVNRTIPIVQLIPK